MRALLMHKMIDQAMLFSYCFFKAAEEKFDMDDKKQFALVYKTSGNIFLNSCRARIRFNQVFIPFIKFLELDSKSLSQSKYEAYHKIKEFITEYNCHNAALLTGIFF